MTDHDHDSNLTDSIDDENFIALLQYRDAYHILNLPSPSEAGTTPTAATDALSPETIEKAYKTAKEQAELALEQFEAKRQANSHQGGRNMFFISHQNYLELKLQALDQAYEELMPPPVEGMMIVEKRVLLHAEEVDFDSPRDEAISKGGGERNAAPATADASLSSAKKSVEKKSESTSKDVAGAREFVWNDKSGDAAAVDPIADTNPALQQQQSLQKQELSEDELDTIDIYFRPTTNSRKGADPPARHRTNTPSSEHPSDVSSCTWDGSSIFSMISQTKKNWEDAASEGGLSDVLGPKMSVNTANNASRAGVTELNTQESKEGVRRYTNRPPTGVNVKHNMKKQAQISPTSVTCFPPSIHNDQHYDTTSGRSNLRSKATLGRGKRMMGKSRARTAHEATEAARMGILRALSEDNSECLPLDDDDEDDYDYDEYNNEYINALDETQDTSGEAELNHYNLHGGEQDLGGRGNSQKSPSQFHGKSDHFAEYNNSTPNENTQSQEMYNGSRSSSEAKDRRHAGSNSMRERPNSPKPLTYSRRQQTKTEYSNDDQYESLVQTGIVGALELADEFCAAINSCWKDGAVGSPSGLTKTLSRAGTVATAAFDAAAYELERSAKPLDQSRVEDESTMYSRSTYDGDSAYHNRSVYTTDGESTAFNTTSSFSRRAEPSSMMENRQRASRSASANGPPASQSQVRMLV